MTTVESNTSSCTFSDALYVTACDQNSKLGDGSSSVYFSTQTHIDSSSVMDDSGMPCTSPHGFIASNVDMGLLEETLDGEFKEKEINYKDPDTKSETLSNSFIIVSSSHERHKSSSSTFTLKSGRSSRNSSHSAFTFDGNISADDFCDQPSMEYDDTFTPCAQSSPSKDQKREKIYIRELSFDELEDVSGVDLMAPVFLAVTNEADDNVRDLKRKCRSIENLCSKIEYPDLDDSFLRKRSKSAVALNRRIRRFKPSPLTMDDTDVDLNTSLDEAKSRLVGLSTSMKSHLSYEDVRLPSSTGSYDVCNSSTDFEMPNSEEYLPSPGAFSLSDQEIDEENREEMQLKFKFSLNTQELIRTPERVQGSSCGFWEYPYGSPTSPSPATSKKIELLRSPSLNTSPKSSQPSSQQSSDRFVVVSVAGQQRIVDMKLIENYLKILTHGGHHVVGKERRVIVVFNAYYLPKRDIPKYNIVMEQLFYYCVHAVDLMVMDSYEIVFFNSAMDGANIPSRQWIRQYYDMIQYSLKKNLQKIFFVHPSLLLKTVLRFTHFFVSSKFRRKVYFVKNLKALKNHLPLEYIFISQEVKQLEKKFT